jgi:hypothetical protein
MLGLALHLLAFCMGGVSRRDKLNFARFTGDQSE